MPLADLSEFFGGQHHMMAAADLDEYRQQRCTACKEQAHDGCRALLSDPHFGEWCECDCWLTWRPGEEGRGLFGWIPEQGT
jgi:hypothetical protein